MSYLHALALSVASHPFLTLAALWALLCPLADMLPEHKDWK